MKTKKAAANKERLYWRGYGIQMPQELFLELPCQVSKFMIQLVQCPTSK